MSASGTRRHLALSSQNITTSNSPATPPQPPPPKGKTNQPTQTTALRTTHRLPPPPTPPPQKQSSLWPSSRKNSLYSTNNTSKATSDSGTYKINIRPACLTTRGLWRQWVPCRMEVRQLKGNWVAWKSLTWRWRQWSLITRSWRGCCRSSGDILNSYAAARRRDMGRGWNS